MKKTSLLLLSLLLFSGVSLHSQISEEPQIMVTGTATELLAPDLMHWRLEITTRSQAVRELAEPHSDQVKRVLAYLKDEGVEQKHITTSQTSLAEQWEWEDRVRRFKGYIATTSIKFKTPQLHLYDQLWIGLSEIDGVSIDDVSLDVEDKITIRKRLRIEALEAAKEKAEEMAAVLGEEIAGVIFISEDEKGYAGPSVGANLSVTNTLIESFTVDGSDTDTSLAVGQISLRARVLVAFRLSGKSQPPN